MWWGARPARPGLLGDRITVRPPEELTEEVCRAPDGEALFVHCRGDDTAVKGTATINRKTSHGTSTKVLTMGRHGVAFDSERGFSEFYAFVDPTGKKGWNSVTLTATCRVA